MKSDGFSFGNAIKDRYALESKDGVSLSNASPARAPVSAFTTSQPLSQAHEFVASNVLPTSASLAVAASGGHALSPDHGQTLSQFAKSLDMMKTGLLSNFDSMLAQVYQQAAKGGAIGSHTMFDSALHSGAHGEALISIDVVAANHDGGSLLAQLQALGMTSGHAYGAMASGTIAVSQLGALAHLLHDSNLGFAHASSYMTSAGLVESQADIAEHADTARADYGVDGSGFRIGVLSDSFDVARHVSDDMADNIASDDLPTDTTILNDDPNTHHATDEGRGMAQLIHDIAPGASIDFDTAEGGQATFAQHILDLATAGDSVIVDDVIYFFELAYQEGPIAQAVDTVSGDGVMYFSSAGNNGHEGLEQNWTSGGTFNIHHHAWTLMQFASGQDYIPITFAAGTQSVIILQWANPGASAGGAGATADLDLFMTNQTGDVIYTSSIGDNIGFDPVEGIGWGTGTGGTYYLRVGLASGAAPTEIKLVSLSNGFSVDLGTDAGNFNDGTMYGHAAASSAIAVGAARYDATPAWGLSPAHSESFTSAGFTRILYDNDGNLLGSPSDRTVDITAVDGANTTFFGGGDYEGDGRPNFFGTSAAAPDAAAVALLVKEANGALTNADVFNLIQDSALDMDNAGTVGFDQGPDNETGSGLIQANLAVGFASTLIIQNDDARFLTGTHLGDTIYGNGNANVIDGGDGDDFIYGSTSGGINGSGTTGDVMHGGDGDDTFIFRSIYEGGDPLSGIRIPTINDFDAGGYNDTLDLSGIDADTTQAGNQAFHIRNHVHGGAGTLIVQLSGGNTFLYAFTDGDHNPEMVIKLTGDHTADIATHIIL